MTNAELIGVPFKYGGRDPNGFDCYGLCRYLIERDTGRAPPDYTSPTDRQHIQALMVGMAAFWKRLERPKKGCLVMFRVEGLFSHVGIVISDSHFIHTWEQSGGVVIEKLETWKHRIVGLYEYCDDQKAA